MLSELQTLGLNTETTTALDDAAPALLVEHALENGEGKLTRTGALAVETAAYTGRSPRDRFIVDTPDVHDKIAWSSVNMPISIESYERIKAKALAYIDGRDLYIEHCLAGANRDHSRKILVICERASQALFANNLFVRPTVEELHDFGAPDFTVIAVPGCTCDPAADGVNSEAAVLINFQDRMIIICGTSYAGEIKKAVFSVMNFLMVDEDHVLPMHCSANMDRHTGDTCIFFGLSGTGKTTLSADQNRRLIGDDEHGWSYHGVFNFEGGCYAKTIRITPETEPQIFDAIRFGALVENVVVNPETRVPDYFDASLTENGRAGYPISFIDDSVPYGVGEIPSTVIFLTADAFGVLPPVARLDQNAAMCQFISGFTSKVAGTERGIVEPVPTFSTLFGEPFMPLDPGIYAELLGQKIEKHKTRVYLVNTGWTGGPYGVGTRMKLAYTRAMVTAIQKGKLDKAEFRHDDLFNLDVPLSCPGVPDGILDPKSTWADKDAYDAQAHKLAEMFRENLEKKYPTISEAIRNACPGTTSSS